MSLAMDDLLTLNVDLFKPFVHGTTYSTSALHLTVQNLPREEHFQIENLLLVGILLVLVNLT